MKTAQRAAQATLDASINAARLDQRPWVTVSRFALSAELDNNDVIVTVWVKNTGKTPALDLEPASRLFNYPMEPVGADTGDVQFVSRGILPPGETGLSFDSAPLPAVPGVAMTRYKAGMNAIYIRAVIKYRDAFKVEHWTKVCAEHLYGRPLNEFLYCSTGNDVDNNVR